MFTAHLFRLLGLLIDLTRLYGMGGGGLPENAPLPSPPAPGSRVGRSPITAKEAYALGAALVRLLRSQKLPGRQYLNALGSGLLEQRPWVPTEAGIYTLLSDIDAVARLVQLSADQPDEERLTPTGRAAYEAAVACGLAAYFAAPAAPAPALTKGDAGKKSGDTPPPGGEPSDDTGEAPPV